MKVLTIKELNKLSSKMNKAGLITGWSIKSELFNNRYYHDYLLNGKVLITTITSYLSQKVIKADTRAIYELCKMSKSRITE